MQKEPIFKLRVIRFLRHTKTKKSRKFQKSANELGILYELLTMKSFTYVASVMTYTCVDQSANAFGLFDQSEESPCLIKTLHQSSAVTRRLFKIKS